MYPVPMQAGMMNPRQLSTPTPALLWVVFAAGHFRLCSAMGSEARQTTGGATPTHISVPSSSAAQELTTALQPSSMSRHDLNQTDLHPPSKSHVAMTELSLAGDIAHEPIAVNKPEPTASTNSRACRTSVRANRKRDPSDIEPVDINKATKSIEMVDECQVVDICVDRYLWALYQRTPKEDTIRIREWKSVTIKRKGKRVSVSRAFTKLVDQNFGWKDPKAAERVGMSMMDYVIGGMDRSFKLKLFRMFHAAEAAGLSPGITSAFRDDYRQSIASGLKAASNRSYHGGSLRGGYGHGLAADVVSVEGGRRNQRFASSEKFWKWVDAHGKEFGIGRPYLGRDPPHVAPVDGQEYAKHSGGTKQAASDVKKVRRAAIRGAPTMAKRARAAAASKMRNELSARIAYGLAQTPPRISPKALTASTVAR